MGGEICKVPIGDAHRGVQYSGGPDSPDVVGLPGIHLEVKRTERCELYKFLEQAKNDADEFEMPVVLHRQNGRQWVAIMDAEVFLELYTRKEESNGRKQQRRASR